MKHLSSTLYTVTAFLFSFSGQITYGAQALILAQGERYQPAHPPHALAQVDTRASSNRTNQSFSPLAAPPERSDEQPAGIHTLLQRAVAAGKNNGNLGNAQSTSTTFLPDNNTWRTDNSSFTPENFASAAAPEAARNIPIRDLTYGQLELVMKSFSQDAFEVFLSHGIPSRIIASLSNNRSQTERSDESRSGEGVSTSSIGKNRSAARDRSPRPENSTHPAVHEADENRAITQFFKEETKKNLTDIITPPALKNYSQNCFMNASLQCCIRMTKVREVLDACINERPDNRAYAIFWSQINISYMYSEFCKHWAPEAHKDFCEQSWRLFYPTESKGSQQDASDFLHKFFSAVARFAQSEDSNNEIAPLLNVSETVRTWSVKQGSLLQRADFAESHPESTPIITIALSDQTLAECLNSYFSPTAVQTSEGQKLQQRFITQLPTYLCVALKRKVLNDERRLTLIENGTPFGLEENVEKYLHSSCTNKETIYALQGVIFFSGDVNAGHYSSIVTMGKKWFYCNDEMIFEKSIDEIRSITREGKYILNDGTKLLPVFFLYEKKETPAKKNQTPPNNYFTNNISPGRPVQGFTENQTAQSMSNGKQTRNHYTNLVEGTKTASTTKKVKTSTPATSGPQSNPDYGTMPLSGSHWEKNLKEGNPYIHTEDRGSNPIKDGDIDYNHFFALAWDGDYSIFCTALNHLADYAKATCQVADKLITQVILAEDSENMTLLHVAAQKGHYALCSYLVTSTTNTVLYKNNLDETPLHLAVKEGRTNVIRLLIKSIKEKNPSESCAKFIEKIQPTMKAGDKMLPPFHLAVFCSRENSLDKLFTCVTSAVQKKNGGIQRIMSSILTQKVGPEEYTLLHLACLVGSKELVKYLIEKASASSVDRETFIYAKDAENNSPLHLAIRKKNAHLIPRLLRAEKSHFEDSPDNILEANTLAKELQFQDCIDALKVKKPRQPEIKKAEVREPEVAVINQPAQSDSTPNTVRRRSRRRGRSGHSGVGRARYGGTSANSSH